MTTRARPRGRHVGSLALLCLAALVGACTATSESPDRPPIPDPTDRDRLVATSYPTLAEIYQGAQGIYRGCGPNGNVCHNSRQYPNMNTLGALALNINQPCNQLQDDPTRIDDWCERQGDTVTVGDQRLILAYIQRVAERTDTAGSRWAVVVQGAFPALSDRTNLGIVRVRPGRDDDGLFNISASHLTADPARPGAVFVQLDADDENRDRALTRAGIPAERDAIQFGDPNRNGVFGLGLGNALIVAGHPERSYIIRRLTDPSAGPLMPLANCCYWSHESLRALWCWIANLAPDGANAMDPIDYRVCPEGPVESLDYPVPGPTCENNGLCPVRARNPIPDDPTWANVYANVLVTRCGGSDCHRSREPAGTLDLGTSEVAYAALVPNRVVPGNPAMSMLVQRLTQACEVGGCRRMPLFQAPLPPNELSVITRWIQNGARMDGTVADAGMMDASVPDAGMMDVSAPDVSARDVSAPDVGMDVPAMGTDATDTAVPDTAPPGMDVGTDVATDVGMDAGTDADM